MRFSSLTWAVVAFGLCLISIIIGHVMPIPFSTITGFFSYVTHNPDIFASRLFWRLIADGIGYAAGIFALVNAFRRFREGEPAMVLVMIVMLAMLFWKAYQSDYLIPIGIIGAIVYFWANSKSHSH
jgi:hypothetical protein